MIRKATENDILAIAEMNRQGFSGNKPPGMAEKWVASHFAQGDQYHYYVEEKNEKVVGYIGWEVRGGFAREIPVIELEQMGVHQDFRGQGIATHLVEQTFLLMKQWVKHSQPEATHCKVFVWSRHENKTAQSVYKNIFLDGIKGERSIYSTDEVLLRGTYEL